MTSLFRRELVKVLEACARHMKSNPDFKPMSVADKLPMVEPMSHSRVMNTATSVDEEMVFDAIEQDPNAEEFY